MDIYTDGATSNNGKNGSYGGWSFVVVKNNEIIYKEYSDKIDNITNNRCELLAIINACKYSENNDETVNIYSDSAYCMNCYIQKWYKNWESNGWITSSKKSVANKDLWMELIPFFNNDKYNFFKVKGHESNIFNNEADRLAVLAKGGK